MIWFLASVGKASESTVALKHSENPNRDVDRRMEGVSSYRKIWEFSRLRSKNQTCYFLFLSSFYLLLALKGASRTSCLRFDGQIHILSKKEVRFPSLLQEAEINHRPWNTFYSTMSVEELESLASAGISASLSLSESFENYIYLFRLSQIHWKLAVTLTGIRI